MLIRQPLDQYLQSAALSSSDLKAVLRSPAHYIAHKSAVRVESKAQRIGTLAHCAILEPARYNPIISPKVDRRTKEGKALWEAFLASAVDRDVIDADEAIAVDGMVAAVRESAAAQKLLKSGEAEVSCFATYDHTEVRCRPDWHCAERRLIVSLKTAEDAAPDAFARQVASYRYHLQMAVEMYAMKEEWGADGDYAWLVVEKEPPYAVSLFRPDPHMVSIGFKLLADAVSLFQDAVARDAFAESRYRFNEEISLPRWAWEV